MFVAALIGAIVGGIPMQARAETAAPHSVSYTVYPVGWVRKLGEKTYIEIDKRYRPALMGVERLQSLWVLYPRNLSCASANGARIRQAAG
jgi:tRNA (Thr-GGU) A37 N-methylase